MRDAGDYDPDTIRTQLVAARLAQVDARKRRDPRAMVATTDRINELLDLMSAVSGVPADHADEQAPERLAHDA